MNYRVIGDTTGTEYSQHRTEEAALRAARALAHKWGWSHPGTEPRAQRLTDTGWKTVASFTTA